METTDHDLSSLFQPATVGDGASVESEISEPSSAKQVFDPINLRDRVVIKLLFDQVVRIEQIEKAWYRWKELKEDGKAIELWRVLSQDSTIDSETVYGEASSIYAFKTCPFKRSDLQVAVKNAIDHEEKGFWKGFVDKGVLPAYHGNEAKGEEMKWMFVTHDPIRPAVNQLIRGLKLNQYEVLYAPESFVKSIIEEEFANTNEYLERIKEDGISYDLGMSYDQKKSELVDEDALEAEISRSKLLNLFEAMLIEAVRQGASDIHLFPNPKRQVEIHFRRDGELECWHVEDRVHPEAFLAIVKDNSTNVDRFERETAQDGFIQRTIDDALIRYRVSILPIASSVHELRSESIVIRVLDDRKVILDLKKLGLHELALERFDHAIRQPYGMVILTGPTGSGKTTTLNAALQQVVTPKKNVLTVEDPVEYILPGVRQIKLGTKLTMEQALRAILRHDPDIVMVGEMRDKQTAELGIKLANTGHVTFSTLHTNDAPSAVSRLYKMGVEPFLIAYAINLVVAQRLIKRLCPSCKVVDKDIDPDFLIRLGFDEEAIQGKKFYTGGDNPKCKTCGGSGYKGRRAITETMLFTPAIRKIIVMSLEMIDEDALRDQAREEGMMTLQDSAMELVLEGDTSFTEMMRVVFTEM